MLYLFKWKYITKESHFCEIISANQGYMEEDHTYSSNITCTDYSTSVFVAVTAVRTFSGIVSLISSLFVIALIVIFKKYIFYSQRMILYLSIAVTFSSLVRVTQGINYPYYPDNEYTDIFCIFIGFIDQLTIWWVIMANLVIALHVYIKAVHKRSPKLEVVYVITIFLFPLTFSWIPFIHLTYGEAGPWCWIKRINSDCTDNQFGIGLRYGLLYAPAYIILFAIIVMYLIIYITVRRHKNQFIGNYDPELKKQYLQLVKEVTPLIWYPIILMIAHIPGIANRIAEEITDKPIIPLWFIHAFVYPLLGGMVCLVYALDPDTRKRLRKSSWKSFQEQFKQEKNAIEYPVAGGCSDSLVHPRAIHPCNYSKF